MLGLISFIVVIVGAINWFCIGLLQFDFVAGLFGSQSSIFSRIVYIAVGLGALILLFNLIENKGKIKFNFKKKTKELENNTHNTYYSQPRMASIEASKDNSINNDKNFVEVTQKETTTNCENGSCEIEYKEKENISNNTSNNNEENPQK